jgi:glycosyltransferase involved in cell wall biosynthesis
VQKYPKKNIEERKTESTDSKHLVKISFLITNAPPLVGGLEKVCLRLAQNFKKAGHEVQILGRFSQERHSLKGFFEDSEKSHEFEYNGVNVRVLGLDARTRLLMKPVFKLIWRKATFPVAKWLYVAALGMQLRKVCTGSDVVHFFGNGPEMLGFAAEVVARTVGAKFFVEPALHEHQWGDKWLDALLYKRADLLLAHTRHEAGVLKRMGIPSTKIRTIVHGVDFCDSGDGERFRKKHGISGPMVLFLGRKTKEKGVERLLKAWPMVLEKFPEATLVFAGPKSVDFENLKSEKLNAESGNLPATSHSLPATAPKARVLNLDDLPEEDKQDALAACDLLCVPSEGESFGMVYFEAWAYGKPVVGLDLPVLRETIAANEAGIIVSMGPDELADAVCKLLGHSQLRQEMGQNGRKVVRHHYWEEAASSYLKAYSAFGQGQR